MARRKRRKKPVDEWKKFEESEDGGRRLWPYIGLTVAAIGALTVLSHYKMNRSLENVPTRQDRPRTSVEAPAEIPSEISFEQAAANAAYRQGYLEQLVEEEMRTTDMWQYFDRLVYDPGLKLYEAAAGTKPVPKYYVDAGSGINVPVITHVKKSGEKPICYVSELLFNNAYVNSEEEIKSVLDNEAANAYLGFLGYIPVKTKRVQDGEISRQVRGMAAELYSFDYQLKNILTGKRKVSDRFMKLNMTTYKPIYGEMEKTSQRDDNDGDFAKDIMDSLMIKIGRRKR